MSRLNTMPRCYPIHLNTPLIFVDMCGNNKKGKKTLTQLILSSPRSKVKSQVYVWCHMSIQT